MRRIFLPLTDEEFASIKAAATAKQITVTSLVREALGLPVAKRGRPARRPTVAELTGSDPDFTGEMSTDEYIQSIRQRGPKKRLPK